MPTNFCLYSLSFVLVVLRYRVVKCVFMAGIIIVDLLSLLASVLVGDKGK